VAPRQDRTDAAWQDGIPGISCSIQKIEEKGKELLSLTRQRFFSPRDGNLPNKFRGGEELLLMGRLFIHQVLVLLLEIRQLLAFPLVETRHQLVDQRSQRVVRFQI